MQRRNEGCVQTPKLVSGSFVRSYGDQAFLVLKHVAKHGTVDKDAYAEEVYAHFGGPDSPYDPLPTTVYHEQGTPSGKTKRYEREYASFHRPPIRSSFRLRIPSCVPTTTPSPSATQDHVAN